MQRVGRRTIAGLALAVATLVVSAGPAGADPARPTNYRSEVTFLEPASASAVVAVDIIGGDAFLRIRVQPDHEVVIRGYDDEPYVRVRADGVVEQNEWSNAIVLNTDRYGGGDGTPSEQVDPDAEPRWVRVGDGGEFVWHDHRAHWMGKATPPQLGDAAWGVVYEDWVVPIDIDGVSALGQFGLPVDAGRQYHHLIVPAIAFVAAVGALLLRRTPSGIALLAGSALTAILWALIVFGVLTHAHAPTAVAEGLQRAVVSGVFGVAGACVAVGIAAELRTTASRTAP